MSTMLHEWVKDSSHVCVENNSEHVFIHVETNDLPSKNIIYVDVKASSK